MYAKTTSTVKQAIATVRESALVLLVILLLVSCGGTDGNSQEKSQDKAQESPEQLGRAFTVAIYKGEFDLATGYIVPALRSTAQSSFPEMQTTLQQSGFQHVESVAAIDYDVGMKKVTIKGGTWVGQLLVTQQGSDWYVKDIQGWTLSPVTDSTLETENTPSPPTPEPTMVPSPTPVDSVNIAAAVAVQGDYAYVGEGYRFAVVDIHDPGHPRVVGRTEQFPGEVNDVAVDGKWAYLTDGAWGLRIIDISEPSTPAEVGFYETNWYAFHVTPIGKHAYIADDSTIVIVDLSDPAVPEKIDDYSIGSRTCNRSAGGVVTDKYAYLIYRNALAILDLSSEPPSIRGEYKHVGDYSIPICLNAVAVMEDYLYVTDDDGGILILDVSDPMNPQKLVWYELNDPGNHIISSPAGAIVVAGEYAYVSFRTEIRVINLADPVAPVEVGVYQVPQDSSVFALHPLDVAVSGRCAYLACGEAGLIILDISNPEAPVEVSP